MDNLISNSKSISNGADGNTFGYGEFIDNGWYLHSQSDNAAMITQKTPPKRLPNGRFMSKSQVEAFRNGVPIDEIVRRAEIEESEKRQLAIEKGVVKKKKPKKKTPTGNVLEKSKKENSTLGPDVFGESSTTVQTPYSSVEQSNLPSQPVLTTTAANLNSFVKMVNGQPVIQARLERIRAPDGNFMTVAVLPSELRGLFRPSPDIVAPQTVQLQRPPSNSGNPTILLSSSPSPSVTRPQSVCVQQKPSVAIPKENSTGNGQQTVVLQHHLPMDRFTFRLSSEDERIVSQLSNQIRQYQSMKRRTPIDDAALSRLEDARTTILRRAASNQYQMLSCTRNQLHKQVHRNSVPVSNVVQIVETQGAIEQAKLIEPRQRVIPSVPNIPNDITKSRDGMSELSQSTSRHQIIGSQYSTLPYSKDTIKRKSDPVIDEKVLIKQRCQRLKDRLEIEKNTVTQEDYATPFRDKEDAVKRLLPYHLCDEPNVNEKLLSCVDSNFQSYIQQCRTKARDLYTRFHKLQDKMTPLSTTMDRLLVNDLMLQDEMECLREERRLAAYSPERFMETFQNQSQMDISAFDPEVVPVSSKPELPRAVKESEMNKTSDVGDESATLSDTLKRSTYAHDVSSAFDALVNCCEEITSGIADRPSVTAPTVAPIHEPITVMENEMQKHQVASVEEYTSATSVHQDDQIEAHFSVKVIIRKRRICEMDDTKPSVSMKQLDVDNGRNFVASVQAKCDEDPLRVPPLKIRLKCSGGPDWDVRPKKRTAFHSMGLDSSDSDDDSILETEFGSGKKRAITMAPIVNDGIGQGDEDENSATTTSPGDSGSDYDDNELDTRQSGGTTQNGNGTLMNDVQMAEGNHSIPRLKIIRNKKGGSFSGYITTTRWSHTVGDESSDQEPTIDPSANEESEDDENE